MRHGISPASSWFPASQAFRFKLLGGLVDLTMWRPVDSTRTLEKGRGTINRSQLPSRQQLEYSNSSQHCRTDFCARKLFRDQVRKLDRRAVRSDHHIATGREHFGELKNCACSSRELEPRSRRSHNVERRRQQIASRLALIRAAP